MRIQEEKRACPFYPFLFLNQWESSIQKQFQNQTTRANIFMRLRIEKIDTPSIVQCAPMQVWRLEGSET